MIIWLASYPKSGNTWLRSIISALLYSDDGVFNFKLLTKIDQFPEKKYFKEDAIIESIMSFKRAGACAIVTYFALDIAKKIK